MKRFLFSALVLCSAGLSFAQTKTFDLLVIAEGNFGSPNADVFKVSRTDAVTTTTSAGLYQTANSTIGFDVLQDFGLFGDKAIFACKPGGGNPIKLAIAQYPSFDSVVTFSNTGGIQCLGKASNQKAYVSTATGSLLKMIDLTNNTVNPVTDAGSLASSYASYMVQANGFMYMAMGSKIVKVDTVTNATTTAIFPGIGTITGMVYDEAGNHIWLLGKVSGISALVKLEPGNSDLLNTPVTLGTLTNAAQLRFANNKLYFLSGKSVHIYNIANPVVPTVAAYVSTLTGSSFSFAYGKSFDVDPYTGDFALASADNFASPSLYEVVDGTTFQVIASGSVSGRIANELTLRTYSAPVPDVNQLADVQVECNVTLDTPTASIGSQVFAATTTDALSYDVQGNYTVTWKYINGYDTTTQTQNIIVDDVTAPVPDIAVLPALQGECPYTVTPPLATDNCKGAVAATTSDPLVYATAGAYTISWQYDDGNGNIATQTQNVQVSCVTGIDDLDAGKIAVTLYPNPAKDNIYLSVSGAQMQNSKTRIVVTDLAGKAVMAAASDLQIITLPVSHLADGFYYITITKEGAGALVKKIVVRH